MAEMDPNVELEVDGEDEDFFDSVVMAEERCQQEGYQHGYEEGKRVGQEQGYDMGREKGEQMGDEMGFYLGFTVTWTALLERRVDEDPSKKRSLKALESLQAALGSLAQDEPNSVKYWDTVRKIRAKFKQVASLLNVSVNYAPGAEQKGLSF